MRCLEDGLFLEVARAYGKEADLQTLTRELRLREGALYVHDVIALLRPQPVTWVFMLRDQPEVSDGRVQAGAIKWDVPQGWKIEVEIIPVSDARMARSFPGNLFRVLITAPMQDRFDIQWCFGRRNQHA